MLKTIDEMTGPPGAHYFGQPWPSGICDHGERVETPLGRACFHCTTPIVVGDQGSFMGNGIDAALGPYLVVHKECSLRSVSGGIKHALGVAHTLTDCEPSGVTYRVSALVVWAIYTRMARVGPESYDEVAAVALDLSTRELPASQADAMRMVLDRLTPIAA